MGLMMVQIYGHMKYKDENLHFTLQVSFIQITTNAGWKFYRFKYFKYFVYIVVER